MATEQVQFLVDATDPTKIAAVTVLAFKDGDGNSQPVANATPLPLAIGTNPIVWTKTTVTMDGSSKQLLAASATRRGLRIQNRAGNADIAYDLAGGTAALVSGIKLVAGAYDERTGDDCPRGAITAIGTNAEVVDVWSGA